MSYVKATRHPVPCLLFVLPLLIVYEYGVISVGGPKALAVRNGADVWLRSSLQSAGLTSPFLAPLIVFSILFIWAFRRRKDPPEELASSLAGMAIESVGFAMGLWALSRMFGPLLDAVGISLATPGVQALTSTPLSQSVTYIGAGVYEETIFRLALYCGGATILNRVGVPNIVALLVAALGSSFAFAAVHHLGAQGEHVSGYVFGFRFIAGLIFTALFALRGFGITVGAHALYDIFVGVPL